MADPYIKAVPHPEDGKLHVVMDQNGYDLFLRYLSRAAPLKNDSPVNFKTIKDRIDGAFLAGGSLMGWISKRKR